MVKKKQQKKKGILSPRYHKVLLEEAGFIVCTIANQIGGNGWKLEIGDSREREARTTKDSFDDISNVQGD